MAWIDQPKNGAFAFGVFAFIVLVIGMMVGISFGLKRETHCH